MRSVEKLLSILGLAGLLTSCGPSQISPNIAAGASRQKQEERSPIEPKGTASTPEQAADVNEKRQTTEPGGEFRLELGKPLPMAGGEIELLSYVMEEIEASPENSEVYPSGSGVTMRLRVLGSELAFSDLSEGYESVRVVYANGFRVDLLSHDTSQASVVVRVFRVRQDEETLIGEKQRVRVGQRLRVEPGFDVQFLGHGHKRTYPGQSSPLIVHMRYEETGQGVVENSHNVFEPYRWIWQRYKFEIVSHDYNDNMVLRISKLALEPLGQDSISSDGETQAK